MSSYLGFFFYVFLIAICTYITWRISKRFLKILKEVIVFWSHLEGVRSSDHRSTDFKSKFYAFVCETDILDETVVNEIYTFGREYVDTEYSVYDFHKILLKQTHVAMFRDCSTGALRGFMFATITQKKDYTLMSLGTVIISHQYRASGHVYIPVGYTLLKEIIHRPFTPIYTIAKCFGYKSYLSMCRTCPDDVYPQYKKKTPEYIQKIINEHVESIIAEGEVYVRETSVLQRKKSVLKDFSSVITEEDRKNPHINFFAETNPGYVTGDCLVVAIELTWTSVFRVVRKSLRGSKKTDVRTSKHTGSSIPSPRFGKQFSFIDKSSGKYYVPLHESGLFDEVDPGSSTGNQSKTTPILYRRQTLSSISDDVYSSVDLSDFSSD